MRTIKFRGKRLDNKKWVYGYLHKCIGEAKLREFVDIYKTKVFIPISLNCSWILVPRLPDTVPWDMGDSFIDYEVDSETVGQFIGILDKNRKEIYDGDICKTNINEILGIIKWCNHRSCFLCEWTNMSTAGDIEYLVNSCGLEVIGNKFDNPELLKQNEND